MKLICPNPECGWTWNYTGKKKYPAWAACPNCLRRVKLPKSDIPDEPIEIGIMNTEKSIEYLKHRLHNGWMLIIGDIRSIGKIETKVYPPGTVKNRDFEMIGFPHTIFVGKKTDEMKHVLGDPNDFDNLLAAVFYGEHGTTIPTETITCKPDTVEYMIDLMVDRTVAMWDDRNFPNEGK